MSNPNDHDIQVLNGLIGAALDSADIYRDAAAETEDASRRALLEERSFARRDVAGELQTAVRSLGGEPAESGSILAKGKRALMDIRHALMPDTAPIDAIDADEGIGQRFEKAIADAKLSATTRETIRRAHASVADGQAEMRDLKHSLEGQRDASGDLFPN